LFGLFSKKKKQVSFLEKAVDKKVSVLGQCLYAFIPFFALLIHIWIFARIEKLGKGTLYTTIILGIFGGSAWILELVHIINVDQIFISIIIGVISSQFIMLFFLIRWSREWNKKIDESISKMIQERHIGDCIDCGQKLDKFYVNCPSCNRIFLNKGHEQKAELLNKKYVLN